MADEIDNPTHERWANGLAAGAAAGCHGKSCLWGISSQLWGMVESIPPPSPGWIARLYGHRVDLAYWEQRLKEFAPKCERIPHDGESVWALRSDHFNQLQTARDVRKCAITLIEWLNGALALEGNAEPLRLESVGRIDSNGQISFTNFAEVNSQLRGMSAAVNVAVGDVPPPPPEPSEAQKWVKAAEGNADIAKALKHLGQPTNWYDIWTAYEIIEDDIWDSTAESARPTGKQPKRVLLKSKNWVSSDDLRRFAASCNYHRHGAKEQPTNYEKATPQEARQILAQIFRVWLKTELP
jgi:hypothetical protein